MNDTQRAYLAWIQARCSHIPFGGIHIMREVAAPLVDEVFVELLLRRQPGRGPRIHDLIVEDAIHLAEHAAPGLEQDSLSPAATGAPPRELRQHPGRTDRHESPPVPINVALHQSRRCVLLGGPGSGKSTLARHVAYTLASRALDDAANEEKDIKPRRYPELHGRVPVLVILRHFARRLQDNPGLTLRSYLEQFNQGDVELGPREGRPPAQGIQPAHELFAPDQLLFLFDGLDEARNPALKGEIVKAVTVFLKDWPQAMALITSRPVGYQEAPLREDVYELEPLSPKQATTYFENWFLHTARSRPGEEEAARRGATSQARELMQRLQERPQLLQLIQNPLLCTLIGFIYTRRKILPNHRAELYEDCLNTFLYSWENAKETQKLGEYALDEKQDRRILEEAALWMHDATTDNLIPEPELRRIVERILAKGARKAPAEIAKQTEGFITVAAKVSGLLAEMGQREEVRCYGFAPHLSFQEYLAASALSRERDRPCKYLPGRIDSPRWQEVFRLCAAILARQREEESTAFVRAIREEPFAYAGHDLEPRLQRRLKQALWCLADDVEVDWALAEEMVGEWAGSIRVNDMQLLMYHFFFSVAGRLAQALAGTRYAELLQPLRVQLRDMSRSGLLHERLAIVRWKLGEREVLQQALTQCRDADSGVRRTAAQTLGMIGMSEAVPTLLALFRDADDGVRHAAAQALGMLGAVEAVPTLLVLFRDADDGVRYAAAQALGMLGAVEAVPTLLEMCQDADSGVRVTAVLALGMLGAVEAVPTLLVLCRDADSGVRSTAVLALGRLGTAESLPTLLGMCRDAGSGVRVAAALALVRLGAVEAVPTLLEMCRDADSDVRQIAAQALGELGATEAVPTLLAMCRDADSSVRGTVAQALRMLGAVEAVPTLLEMCRDEDLYVRTTAAAALSGLGHASVVDMVVDAFLNDPESFAPAFVEELVLKERA